MKKAIRPRRVEPELSGIKKQRPAASSDQALVSLSARTNPLAHVYKYLHVGESEEQEGTAAEGVNGPDSGPSENEVD